MRFNVRLATYDTVKGALPLADPGPGGGQVQGTGGGSAGANAAPNEAIARAGGAGRGWGRSLIQASALGASESVVVGAGGAENNPGSPGGKSSFGGFVTAAGGDGSVASMTSGTGLNTVTGMPGPLVGAGQKASGGGGGNGAIRLTATQAPAGAGGESRLGHGGYSRAGEGNSTALRGRGGGAGGALSYGEMVNGVAGGDGIVIVELYA